MEAKGYPMGWTRVPGSPEIIVPGGDDFGPIVERDWKYYAIQEMALTIGVGPSAAVILGTYANYRTLSEFEKLPFTEQDKAWYNPFPGLGL